MLRLLFLTSFLLYINLIVFGQAESEDHTVITCKSDYYKSASIDEKYEAAYRKAVTNYFDKGIKFNKSNAVFTIPTVVHIVHDGSPLGSDVNRTDEQIIDQIQRASDRFRHQQTNADTYTNPNYGADTEIDLCLASLDPSGNYTSGVLRYYDPVNSIDPSFDYMNNLAWDKALYNNIFIVKSANGACGYANGSFTVYLASCFNPGLICHELGHHFSLIHTFSGTCENNDCLANGDRVCDTPPKPDSGTAQGSSCDEPANSCTSDEDDLSMNNPYRPVANGGLGDQPDMYANFMDYTGGCWDAFTLGQKVRMHFNLTTNRIALHENSAACAGPSMAANDAGVTTLTIVQTDDCDKSISIAAKMHNYGINVLDNVRLEILINGEVRGSQTFSNLNLASGASDSLVFSSQVILTQEDSIMEIRTKLPNGEIDTNIHNDGNYSAVKYIGGDYCNIISGCSIFNPLTADGPGNLTNLAITGVFPELPTGINTIGICIDVEGDVSSTSERFSISIESLENLGLTNTYEDCNGPSAKKCFVIAAVDYNNLIADGTINISLDPISSAIRPNLCSINQACAYVSVPLKDGCDGINFNPLEAPYNDQYYASGYIKAISPLTNPAGVLLQAADSVIFKTPFSVEAGGLLEVIMADCEK